MVTSLPSLSLSLSVSLSLSHRKYLKHNIGSASALPIISFVLVLKKEEDVTCVELALDVQMNSASGVECSQ